MIVVVGCGNPNRSDDGVGPAVVRALSERASVAAPRADVRFLDAGTDGMAAMFAARGCKTLIVVDACRSGSQPGAVFELPGTEVERTYEPALNLHDFRWDNALHAGRRIFREAFPTDVVVVLIEAQSVDLGLELSAVVARAAGIVVERIEAIVQDRLRDRLPDRSASA